MSRVCITAGCEKVLGRGNKTGLCRACCARSISNRPEVLQARSAAVRLHYSKPGTREAHSKLARASWAQASEERRELSRQLGRKRAASWTPETMALAQERRLAKLFPWLPAAYRPLFRALRDKRYSIEDCRRLIGDQITADKAKVRTTRVSAPTSFAEKLAKVEQGKATLVAVTPRLHLEPTIRRAA